jgi:hypothetical protein
MVEREFDLQSNVLSMASYIIFLYTKAKDQS